VQVLGLFGKKKSRDDIIAEGAASSAAEAEAAAAAAEKKDETFNSGNPKMDMEITKIKAQLESFNEIRKSNSERFSRMSEQMGELRGMIMDTNKTMTKIEVSATKAIDLVESVQPEKLMIEMRKQEGKMESLKANIESNEAMMRDIMEELKKMRAQMNFYKGIEQVAKLNDEVKGEILEIKKVEATIERHADKAETIFLDLEKKFANFEQFEKKVEEVNDMFKGIQGDFDKMKLGISNKAEKKEFLSLMDKFTEFERHTGDVIKLLDERSKHMKQDIKDNMEKMKLQMKRRTDFSSSLEESLPVISSSATSGNKINPEKPMSSNSATQESIQLVNSLGVDEPPRINPVMNKDKGAKPKTNDDNLSDVLKSRRIISHRLSDEEEIPAKAENSEPETNDDKENSNNG
jgi:chromosome segregation ATPase